MARVAIVYESRYGFTEKYAKWLNEEIESDLYQISDLKGVDQLLGYDLILFGSGLYGGKIAVANFIKKHAKTLQFKKFAIFVTCASEGNAEYRTFLKEKNLPEELRKARLFQLRGGLSPKLSFKDSMAASMQKSSIAKKENRTTEELMLLGLFESPKDYSEKENLASLIEFVNSGAWKLQ